MEQEKRTRGRPRKDDDSKRVCPLTVGFSPEEKEALNKLAIRMKMPRSKILREALKVCHPELDLE